MAAGAPRRGWQIQAGDLWLRWWCPSGWRSWSDGETVWADFVVPAGDTVELVLELGAGTAGQDLGTDPAPYWHRTEESWRGAVPDLGHLPRSRDARQAVAVLRGLTGPVSRGIVAAATTSLPERASAGRDYDYRYV